MALAGERAGSQERTNEFFLLAVKQTGLIEVNSSFLKVSKKVCPNSHTLIINLNLHLSLIKAEIRLS